MLHPRLQAQINECLDKKADVDNISKLFKKISESYKTYEEEINKLNSQRSFSRQGEHENANSAGV